MKPIGLLSVLFLSGIVMAACGRSGPEPTPTPTKTPVAAAAETQAQAESQPAPTIALPTPTPQPEQPAVVEAVPEATPEPTVRPDNMSSYTGLVVENSENLKRRPIFVCVNNDPVGRSSHHGLSQADLVYEYIVDGFSVSRLSAMYQSQTSERIGPVRSARLPNVWMTYMYDGVLACSGGSDEVRYLLKNEVGFPYLDADIDDPSQTRYFFSIGEDYRTRMQISTDGVRKWVTDTSVAKDWSRPGFEFSEEPPAFAAGSASIIRMPYPGGNDVEWRYDPNLGGYLRFQGGQQQFDQGNNQPILAQNVIAIVAEHQLTDIVEDSLGTKGVDIALYGFGDFRIFRDGQVYEGTWRADPENPPRWFGPGEAIVSLKPGQSWVQVAQNLESISYQ